MIPRLLRIILRLCPLVLSAALCACDPLIEVGGAYFPCWLFCPMVGAAGVFGVHLALAALRFERFLWRPRVFYAGVFTLLTSLIYLVFFR